MEESLNTVKEWDLYHAYGKFNISYESLIDNVRDCVRDLLHKYYDTNDKNLLHRSYDSIFDIKEEEVPENLIDRPLKLVVSEMSSASVINCLKGLLFELRAQSILSFTDQDAKTIITLLCNKIIEGNELRNKIIHSTSHVWNIPTLISSDEPLSNRELQRIRENDVLLFSRYERVAKDGYDYQTATFKISDFHNYNGELQKLNNFIFALREFIRSGKLDAIKFSGLQEIQLKTKHKSQGS
jgi:hypothetical protein